MRPSLRREYPQVEHQSDVQYFGKSVKNLLKKKTANKCVYGLRQIPITFDVVALVQSAQYAEPYSGYPILGRY